MNDNSARTADDKFAMLSKFMEFKPKIQAALDRQEGEGFTFDHLFDLLLKDRILFFWADATCILGEFRTYPEGLHAHIFIAAGDMDGINKLFERLQPWLKDLGAVRVTTLCRKGFKRTLRKYGWTEKQVWLTKEL